MQLQAGAGEQPQQEDLVQLQAGAGEQPQQEDLVQLQAGAGEQPQQEDLVQLQAGAGDRTGISSSQFDQVRNSLTVYLRIFRQSTHATGTVALLLVYMEVYVK